MAKTSKDVAGEGREGKEPKARQLGPRTERLRGPRKGKAEFDDVAVRLVAEEPPCHGGSLRMANSPDVAAAYAHTQ